MKHDEKRMYVIITRTNAGIYKEEYDFKNFLAKLKRIKKKISPMEVDLWAAIPSFRCIGITKKTIAYAKRPIAA